MAFDTKVTNCNHFKKIFKNYQKMKHLIIIVLICTL